jgi:hypothetical protein
MSTLSFTAVAFVLAQRNYIPGLLPQRKVLGHQKF